jgi:hypothetical protein
MHTQEPSPVDPEVIRFMAEHLSAEPTTADAGNPRLVVWRRSPIAQGDETQYDFTLPAALRFSDGYFLLTVADAIYESGFAAGRATLQAEILSLICVPPKNV